MAIFRGIGGAGDSTTDATLSAVTEQALNAANSATASSVSATNSAASAVESASSATSSASSATVAATSASNAATSATAAAASATASASSATAASGSQIDAADSKNAAAASATAAATSASNASTSATAAATSATSAASSATAAAASETAAAASETAAASSETNAAASESAVAANATAAAASESAAATSATAAATSATSASASATAAAGSASSAATLATAAAASESAAATSETNAAASESSAATSASNASTSASNAATSATNASTSEANALTYKNAAATSATNAANSASAASTSATNAAASESNAATSESNAATSATAASGSASAAATSASNASTSATAAASSASSASTSSTNAATSETNAASSATAAASSASAASTSASNAASSASAAASSASSASASADAALAALDSFDDRYLGQKTSDPTLDNDGNALVAGALYFNTTDSAMKVYDGSQWLSAYASLSGALLASNNLSDISNFVSARTNLGVAIGSDVQAYNANTVIDASYVHTDNNYTTAEKSKLAGIADGAEVNVQSDWNAVSGDAFILNKPTAVSAFTNDAGYITSSASITGNAATATKLQTARSISLIGDVSGSVSFDGSADASITAVVADDSHNHSISTVTGLQTALDGKQPLDGDLTAIAALAGTSGLLKKTAANTWTLDTTSYLSSFTETDPIYTASSWYTTTNNASNWNTAYSWGNHASAGYQAGDADLTAIAALAGTSGLLKKTAANTWTLDTTAYTTNTGTVTSVGGTGSYGGLTLSGTVTSSGNLTLGGTPTGTWPISVSGSSASCTGNAATATTLQTARTINGVSFDGSANITITAAATNVNTQLASLGVGTPASGTAGEIRATNNITAYYSDDRLKTRLGYIENALDKVDSLSGFYYEANETAQAFGYEVKREVGVSAQQVQAILPEIVAPAPIDDRYLTVRYERLVPLLIEAIKELRAEVKTLKGEK